MLAYYQIGRMLFLVMAGLGLPNQALPLEPQQQVSKRAHATGNLTATQMLDGRILFISRNGFEIYDPRAKKWDIRQPNLSLSYHAVNLLPNGTAVISGGIISNDSKCEPQNALISIDIKSSKWQSVGNMRHPRIGHTSTLLKNGQLLIVGGFSGYCPNRTSEVNEDSAELCDPGSGYCVDIAGPESGRRFHTAIALDDNKVLIIGGDSAMGTGATSILPEIYDTDANSWTTLSQLKVGGAGASATRLSDGDVVVLGQNLNRNDNRSTPAEPFSAAAIYDHNSLSWRYISEPNLPFMLHSATAAHDGRLIAVGGWKQNKKNTTVDPIVSSDIWIFSKNKFKWYRAGSIPEARRSHTATLISSDTILVAGGIGKTGEIIESIIEHRIPAIRVSSLGKLDEFRQRRKTESTWSK